MIGVVALRTSADGVGERVVTWCCGVHRETDCCKASSCGPCCPECPTCPAVQRRTPEERAADARELRERQMFIRVAARRAEHLSIIVALDELAAELTRQTQLLLDVAVRADETFDVQPALADLNAAVVQFDAMFPEAAR